MASCRDKPSGQHGKIPLDDLLALTREYLCPEVSRSGLDHCLRRHGVGKLRAMLPKEERPKHQRLEKAEPGFFHIWFIEAGTLGPCPLSRHNACMQRKKLPIGIQTFRQMREEGYYYVDKTPFVAELVERGKYYFLSRPRRFGKSLFLDTLAEAFAGNQALFEGLYLQDHWDWTKTYPVIRIGFAEGTLHSREVLDKRIHKLLRENQAALELRCEDDADIPGCFTDLIRAAEKKFGRRVVVLVDEYDKPILDNLHRPEIAAEMRDGLRNLYSVIKGQDAHIQFAFLTGVSKFSKVSIFSGLNNLEDITLSRHYATICGYTEGDLDEVFAPELEGLDREEVRRWYNGYGWLGEEKVYNPFGLLLLFRERDFRPWWFENGTPSFLRELFARRRVYLPQLADFLATEQLLSSFDVGQMALEALLWQTGYLTIVDSEIRYGERYYRLGYPNEEVRRAMHGLLLSVWASGEDERRPIRQRLQLGELLEKADFAALEKLFTSFFASIPHDWYRNNPIAQYEGYWASVFYAYFAALGLDIVCEDTSNVGRLDMAVKFAQQVFLFEFKVVELEPEGGALAQLKERNYAAKYRALNQPIHLVGVEFSKEQRQVAALQVETLKE